MKQLIILTVQAFLILQVCPALSVENVKPRMIQKEAEIDLPLAEVWNAWTTNKGLEGFLPEKASVELRPGGKYECYMSMKAPEGQRGSEGCRVLSYLPMEMLSFEWNFPPKIPSLRGSGAHTQVNIFFEPIGANRARVRLYQHGWQQGSDWDEGYAYFDRAWGRVLENLQKYKPQNVKAPERISEKSWVDGEVAVTTWPYPDRRQDFVQVFNYPVEKVWNMIATTEGFTALGGKNAHVDLKPGGDYSFWEGAPNKVMAFLPQKMLATSGSAPPQFPNVRKGGTWGVYFLDPIDGTKTRLRLSVIGWQKGEEWERAFAYFNKNNPVFFRMIEKALSAQTAALPQVVAHEAIVDASAADVWDAFTTREGIESWMVPHAEIDFRVGGLMLTNYNPQGVIGDDGTIENTIISYDPQRMLSIKATKPPAKFPFKNALKNMWTVIYLEPNGAHHTNVIVRSMGFTNDEESQKMREHFDKGNAWTLKKLQERFGSPKAADATTNPESVVRLQDQKKS